MFIEGMFSLTAYDLKSTILSLQRDKYRENTRTKPEESSIFDVTIWIDSDGPKYQKGTPGGGTRVTISRTSEPVTRSIWS